MTAVDTAALRKHIGTKMVEEDVATAMPVHALIATFDRPEIPPKIGEPIPRGWHIGYFVSMAPQASLSRDGLPKGSGVLPPMPFPRRMFAGIRWTFHRRHPDRRPTHPRD